MTWLFEDPWPLTFVFGFLGLLLLVVWYSRPQKALLTMGALFLGLIPLVWLFESLVITDSERVEERIIGLGLAFQRQDTEATLAFVSPDNLPLRLALGAAVSRVKLGPDLTIRDISVKRMNPTTLRSRFRANATVTLDAFNAGRQPSRWDVDWKMVDGDWRIVRVDRIHPIKDESMELFQPE